MSNQIEEGTVALGPTPLVAPHFALRRQTLTRALVIQIVLVAMIAGVAGFLRVANLNAVGYNSDEAVYAGQAAAIAQVPVLEDLFPVFRAHPLLFQFVLAVFYKINAGDLTGRLVSAGFGVATVLLVYLLGRRLYGPGAGLAAALLLAVMPYHVVPTRQVLLDGPMTLMATLALYMIANYADTEKPMWLLATGICMGLTFLAKETGILLVGAVFAFLALSPQVRVQIRTIALSLVLMVATMIPFPLSLQLAGGGGQGKTQQYLVWQLFRRPNHEWDFYITLVPAAMGLAVILAAIWGLWILRRQWSWRERLLLLWIALPTAFFQVWPTKGFQYLLPVAIPVAVLAGRTLAAWPQVYAPWGGRQSLRVLPRVLITLALAASLAALTWQIIHPPPSGQFLAGSGGVPGGRELGDWIEANVPEGANFLTIGPSMANIVKYYGHRPAYGLSVSPNPLHRNPSYEPILNPDFRIRTSDLQYLVWDSYSASRSSFFSDAVLYYAKKYDGRVVHTEVIRWRNEAGEIVETPSIIIYEVHPLW